GAIVVTSVVLRRLVHRGAVQLPPKLSRVIAELGWRLSPAQTLVLLAFYVATWALIGVGFALLVTAVGLGHEATPYLIGLFAGSWALGFLVLIAPGGIGVREAVMIAGLGALAPEPYPALIALLARVGWMVGEFAGLGFSYLLKWIEQAQYSR